MSKSKQPAISTIGLAMDWETSGYSLPNYAEQHQGISFGAIIFDTRTFSPIESLYREIKFDSSRYKWSAEAEKVHGITRANLEKYGVSQEEAAADLLNLLMKYNAAEKIFFLGHRAYFDRAFTNQLTAVLDIELPYDPIMIDSAAIGLVFPRITQSDLLFETMGCAKRGNHNSLEDITNTLASIKQMKHYYDIGVEAETSPMNVKFL
jgi:oligoribonuclease (3'-5' exoribonuclease)